MIGSTIGHYTIIKELGRGGMAVVYRAQDRSLNREVALKVLPREFLHDPTFRERFEREAQTIARLEHPAIVPIYDFGEEDGQPFFVMRYMLGGSLADRITSGLLPLEDVSKIIDRIGSALDAAHARGIIHRDVKPSNILFDDYGEAYLSDFGIVRLAEATARLTGSGIVGTPAYMAPEMTQPGGLTSLIDVYALGVTLFEMLSGCQPYQADTPMGTALAHVTNPIPDITDVRSDLSKNVQQVISKALAKETAERYQSGRELSEGLRQALGRSSVEMPVTDHKFESESDAGSTPPETLDESTLPEVDPTLIEVEPEADEEPVSPKPENEPNKWIVIGAVGAVVVAMVAVIALILVLTGAFSPPIEEEAAMEPSTDESTQEEIESVVEEPIDIPEPAEEPAEEPTEELADEPKPTVTLRPTSIPQPTTTPSCPNVVGPFASVWSAVQDGIGCASGNAVTGLIAEENFEYGKMIWREPIDYAQALVLFNNHKWNIFEHTPYMEGSPEYSCVDVNTPAQTPPTPRRGFGMMWCDISEIRNGLGNAVDNERGYDGAMQSFGNGFMIETDYGTIFVFYNNGSWEQR